MGAQQVGYPIPAGLDVTLENDNDAAWTVKASFAEILKSGMLEVRHGRQLVLLIAQDGGILAVQGLCPHQLARLSEGSLHEGQLQCPRHLARFNLSDGASAGGWQLPPLRRYAVRVAGDDVLLPERLIVLDW